MNELLSGHGLYTFIFQTGFSVHFHARFAFWDVFSTKLNSSDETENWKRPSKLTDILLGKLQPW